MGWWRSLAHARFRARLAALGDDHLDTLASKHSLLSTYWRRGKFKPEHEAMFKEIAQKRESRLGLQDTSTMEAKINLAVAYKDLRKYDLAERESIELIQASRLALAASRTITANGLAGRCFRLRSRCTASGLVASQTS